MGHELRIIYENLLMLCEAGWLHWDGCLENLGINQEGRLAEQADTGGISPCQHGSQGYRAMVKAAMLVTAARPRPRASPPRSARHPCGYLSLSVEGGKESADTFSLDALEAVDVS
mmetsp:Transcript_35195/g.83595  ORF Transcript_35195/g.83595 Transcript_35195/m.83595 type:complete len:115 (-) Transcript_35195:441-785(-)